MGDGLEVSGGADGTWAETADMRTFADVADGIGDRLADIAVRLGRLGTDGDLLASSPLSPATAARAEAQVVDAVADIGTRVVAVEGRARGLRAVAASFEGFDRTRAAVGDQVQAFAGTGAIGLGLFGTAAATPWLYARNLAVRNGRAMRWLLAGDVNEATAQVRAALSGAGGDTVDDLGGFWTNMLLEHPGLTDAVVEAPGGVVTALTPFDLSYEQTNSLIIALGGLLGGNFDDSRSIEVTPIDVNGRTEPGYDPAAPDAIDRRALQALRVPAGIADLMSNQTSLQQAAQADPGSSRIRVIEVPQGDDASRWIVQVPGTQEWATNSDDPSDLTTNLHLTGPEHAAMLDAIDDAMRQSGISMDDAVMVTGHSQGGIAAAAFSAQAADRGYNVTDVVTAGSPIAHIDVPDDVRVLSLEHDNDPVPRLDGDDNPAGPNWTTVTGDVGTDFSNPIAPHSSDRYASTGELVDASDNLSVVTWREESSSFFANGGLEGQDALESGLVHDFQVSRIDEGQ